jgi:hypothetical protein
MGGEPRSNYRAQGHTPPDAEGQFAPSLDGVRVEPKLKPTWQMTGGPGQLIDG